METNYPTEYKDIKNKLMKKNIFKHGAMFIRREVYDLVGLYDPYFKLTQDYDFILRVAGRFLVANFPESLVTEIYRSQNMTQKHRVRSSWEALVSQWNALIKYHYPLWQAVYLLRGTGFLIKSILLSTVRKLGRFFVNQRDIFFVLVLTAISIMYFGFYIASGNGDDQTYLLALLQRLHPSLFPNDYFFLEPVKAFTFITDIEVLLYKLFHGNLIYTLFSLYFFVKFLFYYGVYRLSKVLFRSRLAAFAAIFVLFAPLATPYLRLPTYETIVVPRMLVYGAGLLFVTFLLEERYFVACLMLAVVVLLHPISAVYLLVMSLGIWIFYFQKISVIEKIKIGILGAFVVVSFLLKQHLQLNSYHIGLWGFPSSWRDYINVRLGFLFLNRWKFADWQWLGNICLPLIIFLITARTLVYLPRKILSKSLLISLGVLFGLILDFVFVDLHFTPFFMHMELPRAMLYWLYLGLVGLSGLIVVATQKRGLILTWLLAALTIIAITSVNPGVFGFWFLIWLLSLWVKIPNRLLTTFCIVAVMYMGIKFPPNQDIGLLPMLVIYSSIIIFLQLKRTKKSFLIEPTLVFLVTIGAVFFFIQIVKNNFPPEIYYGGKFQGKIFWREYLSQKVYFPNLPTTDWINVQLWAKSNTPVTATFLVPAIIEPGSLTGFRVFSERSIVYDIKDGTMGSFSPKFAAEWLRRDKDLRGNERFTTRELLDLLNKYHFDYILRSRSDPSLDFPVVYQNNSFLVYKIG